MQPFVSDIFFKRITLAAVFKINFEGPCYCYDCKSKSKEIRLFPRSREKIIIAWNRMLVMEMRLDFRYVLKIKFIGLHVQWEKKKIG